MRTILLLAVAACTGDGHGATPHDPHEPAVCDASWGPGVEGNPCEFACVHEDLDSKGPGCTVDGSPIVCAHSFIAPGNVKGCCVSYFDGTTDTGGWNFVECD